jgi:Mrp family chromosome partitioning ATPase
MVFLDGGSVESGAVQWAPWVDAVLIVSDPSRAAGRDWTNSWDRFEESGTHVLGIVETFV